MKSAVLIVVGFIKKVEDTEGSSEFLLATVPRTALLHFCSLPQDGLTLCLLTTASSVFVRCVHTVLWIVCALPRSVLCASTIL